MWRTFARFIRKQHITSRRHCQQRRERRRRRTRDAKSRAFSVIATSRSLQKPFPALDTFYFLLDFPKTCYTSLHVRSDIHRSGIDPAIGRTSNQRKDGDFHGKKEEGREKDKEEGDQKEEVISSSLFVQEEILRSFGSEDFHF